MIHVDRPGTPPEILASEEACQAFESTKKFLSESLEKRIQRSHKFADHLWMNQSVTETLMQLFHRKCAFYENPLSEKPIVEQFRPKTGANSLVRDRKGKADWAYELTRELNTAMYNMDPKG